MAKSGATAFIADVHLGNIGPFGGEVMAGLNARCRATLEALRSAVEIARREGVRRIVSLGDFFDSSATSPQIVAAAQQVIVDSGIEWIFLLGNHEMGSEDPRDTSLAPLAPVATIVVERMRIGQLDLRPYQKDLDTLAPFEKSTVGCIHAGIYDESFPPYAKGQVDAISVARLRELGAEMVVAGNWHAARRWTGSPTPRPTPKRLGVGLFDYLQVGALAPKNFGELGHDLYGKAVLFDDGKFSSIEVPGPRFVRVSSEGELRREIESTHGGCFLFVEWIANGEDERAHAVKVLAEEKRLVMAHRIVPAPLEAGEPGKVKELWSGSTVERAVRDYVERMPLPEGVARSEVLAQAIERLNKS